MRSYLSRLRTGDAAADRPQSYVGALGGIGLLALGLVFVIGGYGLGFGSPQRLGTGAFPMITGIVLAVLAIVVIVADLRDASRAESPDWVSFVAIGGALAVFALTVGRLGLVPGVFLTILAVTLPDPALRLPGKIALGAVVALACWGLFIGLIGLPFDAFRGI